MAVFETITSSSENAQLRRGMLTTSVAADFLCGCVETTVDGAGWVRPSRLSEAQKRALSSCLATRPGLFRQMARTTAGICLRFETDADEVALAVRMDAEPQGTASVLAPLDRRGRAAHDGIGVVVDGRRVGCSMPRVLARPLPWIEGSAGMGLACFSLREGEASSEKGLMTIPGLGKRRQVVMWLPCLRGCAVRELWSDGTFVEPVSARGRLLVLGDSIGQGFCCEDPSGSWAALLSEDLGLELLNQSLAGQVFQPSALPGAEAGDVERVVVELGLNYRWESCAPSEAVRDARVFLQGLAKGFGHASMCLVTPTWYDERTSPSRNVALAKRMSGLLQSVATEFEGVDVVDGSGLVDHDDTLFVDGEHPGPFGHERMAARLATTLRVALGREALRERALGLLEDAPLRAMPLAEAIRRGRAEVCVAEPGCVLARLDDGHQMLFAPDHLGALDLAAPHVRDGVLSLYEPGLSKAMSRATGHLRVVPVHVCLYLSKRRVPVDPEHASAIRRLGEKDVEQVLERYTYRAYVDRASLARRLSEGRFFGAYVHDELIGFVGEHEEGSMGMLEVRRSWRRKGWGKALESFKINDCLDRGELPWTEVYPQNRVSLKMQRAFGLAILPPHETCYLSRRTEQVRREDGGSS